MKKLSLEQAQQIGAGSFSNTYTYNSLTLIGTTTAGIALGVTSTLAFAARLAPNNPFGAMLVTFGFIAGGTLGFSFGMDIIDNNISVDKSA